MTMHHRAPIVAPASTSCQHAGGTTLARRALLAAACALATGGAWAAAVVGQPAPAFSVTDAQGQPRNLADFRGKTVVLEWVNPGCPFVRKHYESGNMQATQKHATGQGVVWLSVNSTAKASVDYQAPPQMQAWMQQQKAVPTATLMDTDGVVGRAYGARTTPHMYVIDKQGVLVYAGAIDNRPTANVADIDGATNHVKQALTQTLAGTPVSPANTRAYGCSIKYADG